MHFLDHDEYSCNATFFCHVLITENSIFHLLQLDSAVQLTSVLALIFAAPPQNKEEMQRVTDPCPKKSPVSPTAFMCGEE